MRNSISIYCVVLALLSIVLAGSSCNKQDDLRPGFDMQYQIQFEIPAGIGPFVVHHFYLRNQQTRFEQLLNQQNKDPEDIAGISTQQAQLLGVFGDENFDFIEEISIRVFTEPDETDFIEVAYRFPVPMDPGNNLPLIPSLADSKRIMEKARFSVDVSLRLRKTTQVNLPVRLDLLLRAIYQ